MSIDIRSFILKLCTVVCNNFVFEKKLLGKMLFKFICYFKFLSRNEKLLVAIDRFRMFHPSHYRDNRHVRQAGIFASSEISISKLFGNLRRVAEMTQFDYGSMSLLFHQLVCQ